MSQSIIEKLLKGADVEWKTLEEVTSYEQPNKYVVQSTNYDDNFATPVLTAGKTFILGYTDDLRNVYQAAKNPVIIFDDFTTDIRWVDFNFKIKSTAIKLITSSNNSKFALKYIYYCLESLPTTKNVNDHKRQWISIFSKKIIPIPPLSVQNEIVRILDAFTAHTAELTEELTEELDERKKQYNYYRDKLLTFSEDEVEWKPLGEVCEFSYGYVAKAQARGDTRFIRISDISNSGKLLTKDAKYVDLTTENKKFVLKKGDLLMARTGATFGKTMYFNEDYRAIYAGFLIKINFLKKQILSKYYWHVAQSKIFWDQANRLVSGGGQPQFNVNVLKNVIIPIPSIEQQKRIVSILDRFDTLTNFISDGLPKEIELRNKQYEYYRDQLFNFPKPGNDAIKQSPTNL